MTRSVVRGAIGTVAVLGILLAVAACGSSTPPTTPAPSSAAANAPSPSGPATDTGTGTGTGKGGLNVSAKTKLFMFTFTDVAYVKSVKDDHGTDVVPRQGSDFQFYVTSATVKHVPGSPDETFGTVFDAAVDADGKEYSNPLGYLQLDETGAVTGKPTQTDFPSDQTLRVKLLWEVPVGVKITGLKLLDFDPTAAPVVVKLA